MSNNTPEQRTSSISLDSLEKKETDANLTEVKFNCLYQNMSDTVILYDYEKEKILDGNLSSLKLFGYSRDELLQLNRFDLIPKYSSFFPNIDVHEHIRKEHRAKVYKGESIVSYVDLIHKQSSNIIGKINIVPIQKNTYQAFVIIHDITRRIKQERALIENQKKYLTILNNSQEAIVSFSLETRSFIDCNGRVCNVFGTKTKEDFLKNSIENYYTDKFSEGLSAREFLHEIEEKTIKAGFYDFVFQPSKLNGEPFIARVRTVYDDSEGDHSKIIFFMRDITSQFEDQQEKIYLLNQQKQILNSIPSPFVFKDLQNNIIACNSAFADAFGFNVNSPSQNVNSPSQMVGTNLSAWLSKEELQIVELEDLSVVKLNHPMVSKLWNYKNTEGENQWYKKDKTPFLNEKGEITGILVYTFNVTELIAKNKRLKQYIESNNQLENFASIASHDLQAPLRTIHSYTQLLQRKLGPDIHEDEKEYMKFILSATSNMRHLIRDLRSYSQVDSSKLNLSEFCMEKLHVEITAELRSSIIDSKAEISYPKNLIHVVGDRIKIKQLLQNLLANALKYIPEGSTPNINISFEDQAEYWYFEIEDNGIGIAEPNQKKIFELFQRLHGSNEYLGTGIGLSLCKKVVEQHQGEIGVKSTLGKGSIFYFTISKNIKSIDELIQ